MKKLFVVLAIGSFAACNGATSTETKIDSAATVAKDSVTVIADSAKSVIDSAAAGAKAKIDSVKK